MTLLVLQTVTAGNGIKSIANSVGWKTVMTGVFWYFPQIWVIKRIETATPTVNDMIQKILRPNYIIETGPSKCIYTYVYNTVKDNKYLSTTWRLGCPMNRRPWRLLSMQNSAGKYRFPVGSSPQHPSMFITASDEGARWESFVNCCIDFVGLVNTLDRLSIIISAPGSRTDL